MNSDISKISDADLGCLVADIMHLEKHGSIGNCTLRDFHALKYPQSPHLIIHTIHTIAYEAMKRWYTHVTFN